MGSLILVSGGVRSGKSAFAEAFLDSRAGGPWTYWASGKACDEEMDRRIRSHQLKRSPRINTVESGFIAMLSSGRLEGNGDLFKIPLLLDNLGFCAIELLDSDAVFHESAERFEHILAKRETVTVIVTDEVGSGGVALSLLGRKFADRIGEWNQRLARQAAEVYGVMMGCPLRLK